MKITLSRLTTKDLATLTLRVVNASKNGAYKVTDAHPLLEELQQNFSQYDAVYSKQSYSGKGQSVSQSDDARNKTFVAIKKFLFGYSQVPSVPNADKANDLYEIIKQFGTDIQRMSYSSKTAQLKKLLEEFDKAENKEKLEELHLTAAVEDLKAKQTAFETVFAEQAEANADLRKLPSASSIRRTLEKSLKNYLNLLEVMKNVPAWKDIYQEINELVKAARNSTANGIKKMSPTENNAVQMP